MPPKIHLFISEKTPLEHNWILIPGMASTPRTKSFHAFIAMARLSSGNTSVGLPRYGKAKNQKLILAHDQYALPSERRRSSHVADIRAPPVVIAADGCLPDIILAIRVGI